MDRERKAKAMTDTTARAAGMTDDQIAEILKLELIEMRGEDAFVDNIDIADLRRLVAEAQRIGYESGWCKCAEWAKRDDLKADVGSPAYTTERDAAIRARGTK